MKITKTSFQGLFIIEPDVFDDSRGYFLESYNKKAYQKLGIDSEFVQDNRSCSIKNVIRGLHFQKAPYAQTKLMQALHGTILDVAVDLRKDQLTFKKVFTLEMSANSRVQLLIPKGFAHGFSVLSDSAEIFYKCDEFYHPECASGIHYADPELMIDWKIENSNLLVSDKDKMLPALSVSTFSF